MNPRNHPKHGIQPKGPEETRSKEIDMQMPALRMLLIASFLAVAPRPFGASQSTAFGDEARESDAWV